MDTCEKRDESILADAIDKIKSNNNRLLDSINRLECMNDRVFGCTPSDVCGFDSEEPETILEELVFEIDIRQKVLLNRLETEVERLKKL